MTRRWLWLFLALALPSCGLFPPIPIPIPTPPPVEAYDCQAPPQYTGLVAVKSALKDRYIVVLKSSGAAASITSAVGLQGFAARFKVQDVQPLALVRAFAAKIEGKHLGAVLADPNVAYIQQEGTKTKRALSWGLDRSDQRALPLDKGFAPDGDGAGVDIWINDTGVTRTADLGDRLSSDCFSTIVFRGCEDGHGHGTHVAGTAAGTTWGVAKKATVHSVRFLDEKGSGTDSDAIRTLDWIAQHAGGGVVNASWGGSPAPAVDAAVCRVIESGKVFVAAAGNDSADAYDSTPARILQVVTVGASDRDDSQAYFSNFGPGLDVYAPGVDIESDTPSGGTTTMSGTSMATPHVVGAAALLIAKYPGETPAQIRDRLVAAATPGVIKGPGAGSPNRLLFVGKEGSAPPPPIPPPPAETACPKELAPGATVYLNDKPYGHGFDSTVRVSGDPEFCWLIHGEAVDDCHLEGWPQRSACEMGLIGGCPIWQYRTAAAPTPERCLQPAHPVASCDHWGTAGGAQDDPHTPAYEGMPAECGYQRVDGLPAAGFYAVVRGKGETRACKPDATGCGPWRPFDR